MSSFLPPSTRSQSTSHLLPIHPHSFLLLYIWFIHTPPAKMYTIKSKMASVFWVNYCYCCDCYYLHYKRLILFDLVIHLHNNHPCRIYMYLYWHVPRLGWLINKFRLFQRTIFYCENKTKYTCTTNKQNVPTQKKILDSTVTVGTIFGGFLILNCTITNKWMNDHKIASLGCIFW